ncbi:hypothetical protein L603_001400000420 [Cellulosimicrobium cellulans J34]|nr:hypothetical protein L603_001400000420 [Cellulosimicrobium cellulans J34]
MPFGGPSYDFPSVASRVRGCSRATSASAAFGSSHTSEYSVMSTATPGSGVRTTPGAAGLPTSVRSDPPSRRAAATRNATTRSSSRTGSPPGNARPTPSRSPPPGYGTSPRSRGHTTSNTSVVPGGSPAPVAAYGPVRTVWRDVRSTPGSPAPAVRAGGTSGSVPSGATSQRAPAKRESASVSTSSTRTSAGSPRR